MKKHIWLSADSPASIYLVPDVVAKNLRVYIDDFYKWMETSATAAKHRMPTGFGGIGLCFNDCDFIAYLNDVVFTDRPCKLVDRDGDNEKYPRDMPGFNF
ncbi:MAG: hypothetical protein FWD06_01560 [Oscillospiraceae bacterium]|nr:hypothetical protein [Oscillospiraceae bacterium]